MNDETISKIESILNKIHVTDENEAEIEEIRKYMDNKNYAEAIKRIERLLSQEDEEIEEIEEVEKEGIYPKELSNPELERKFIGLLLQDPKYIVKFYFLHQNCRFEDPELENIYKSVLFTEGRSLQFRSSKTRLQLCKRYRRSIRTKKRIKTRSAK